MVELVSEEELWSGNYQELNKMFQNMKPRVNNTINDMLDFQDKFMNKNFPDVEDKCEIKINNRLKYVGGQVEYFLNTKSIIEINGKSIAMELLFHNEMTETYKTLSHELVHFGLYKSGKHDNDGDDDFELMLKTLNLPSSDNVSDGLKYGNTETSSFYRDDYYENKTSGEVFSYGGFKKPRKYVGYKYLETKVLYRTFK